MKTPHGYTVLNAKYIWCKAMSTSVPDAAVKIAVSRWQNGGYTKLPPNTLVSSSANVGNYLSTSGAMDEINPTAWEKLIVKWPVAVFLATLLAAATMAGSLAFTGDITMGSGYTALRSVTQQRIDGFGALIKEEEEAAAIKPKRRRLQADRCSDSRQNYIYYEAVDKGNLLTEEHLKSICKFERGFLPNAADYSKYRCTGGSSIVNNPNVFKGTTASCELQDKWYASIAGYAEAGTILDAQFRKIATNTKNATIESKYIRTIQNFDRTDAGRHYLKKDYPAYLDGQNHVFEGIKIYYRYSGYLDEARKSDIELAAYSILVVVAYLAVKKGLFLALIGILEIVLSLPLALSIWYYAFGRKFITMLMMISIFLILGIGADDIFVLTDSWELSAAQPAPIAESKLLRFCWAYRRAANAMTVTSFTTCMAFMAAAWAPVPAISAFGQFAAFAVLFDFILVITLFASAMMIHDKYFTWGKKGTSKDVSRAPSWDVRLLEGAAQMLGKLPKLQYAILAIFGLIALSSVYLTIQHLPAAESFPDQWPANSPLVRYNRIHQDGFQQLSGDGFVQFHVVWGMDHNAPIDRGDEDPLTDAENRGGTAVYDTKWQTDAMNKDMQVQMVKVCNNIYKFNAPSVEGGKLIAVSPAVCLPHAHQQWCVANNIPWPAITGEDLYQQLNSKSWTSLGFSARSRHGGYSFHIDENDMHYLKAAWVSFDSTLVRLGDSQTFPNDVMKRHDSDWKAFLGAQDVQAWHTSEVLSHFVFVTTLSDSARSGIILSLGITFAALIISTANMLVSVIAMSSIVGSMLTCFAAMALLGWEVSVIESICMIIVVGMAVDYAVHVMHTYSESSYVGRFGKAKQALTEMAPSVVGGAITTVGASLPLLFANMQFFNVFGHFMLILTGCSIAWSIFYLVPLAMCVGPQQGEYDIPVIKYWLRGKSIPNRGLF